MSVRVLVNPAFDPGSVAAPSSAAREFHRGLPGFEVTRLSPFPELADELSLGSVSIKDESNRIGLPAFKILGASWAAECALREDPGARMLVTASAGNHGRAVARVAAMRGLECRVYLPERSVAARREAIAGEGAEVVIVAGSYEDAVAESAKAARAADVVEVADVGDSGAARAVIDGYATLLSEIGKQAENGLDVLLVPVGVGSLAAAAARFGAAAGVAVVGVEPERASCLTASLEAGRPVAIETPGTVMAGMDCAEVSPAAWPDLRAGVRGTVMVGEGEIPAATEELERYGVVAGECGAASLSALRLLAGSAEAAELRDVLGWGTGTRVVTISTEGRTGDPA